jgi:hypothetical protein
MRFADVTLRGELYLRNDTYGTFEVQREIADRVERLAADGPLGAATVGDCWQSIHASIEDCRDEALETFDVFGQWAERNGFTLEPAFQRRTRSFLGTDREQEVVVFPVVSFALYEDDALQAVFPCSDADGARHHSVGDCLDAFESCHWEWFDQFRSLTVDRDEPLMEATAQSL